MWKFIVLEGIIWPRQRANECISLQMNRPTLAENSTRFATLQSNHYTIAHLHTTSGEKYESVSSVRKMSKNHQRECPLNPTRLISRSKDARKAFGCCGEGRDQQRRVRRVGRALTCTNLKASKLLYQWACGAQNRSGGGANQCQSDWPCAKWDGSNE